jgi:hypothetical protein
VEFLIIDYPETKCWRSPSLTLFKQQIDGRNMNNLLPDGKYFSSTGGGIAGTDRNV